MKLRPRNWLYETNRQETERRLSAVESNLSEVWLVLNDLQFRLATIEATLNPPVIEPEEA